MVNTLELLARAALVGATAAGIVHAVRALRPVAKLVEAGVKPWACDVCASFWATVLVVTASGALWGVEGLMVAGPAYPIAYYLTRALGAPQGFPPPPDEGASP